MTLKIAKGLVGNKELILETGRMAKQAHGAVVVRCGDTMIMATAVAAREPREGIDFFPLTVDYREKTYSAGKIPGGYFKREGRPTEKEILTSRLIDRPIRPLFPEGFVCETQVMVSTLSVDGENPTEILAINGASAALLVSDIPFTRPIGAVRVGMIDGQYVLNPTLPEQEQSALDLVLVGLEDKVLMIEAGANEISEEQMMEAIRFGQKGIKEVIAIQKALQKDAGKAKRAVAENAIPQGTVDKVKKAVEGEFEKIFGIPLKEEREEAARKLMDKVLGEFNTEDPEFKSGPIKSLFDQFEKEKLRAFVLDQNKRPDGRGIRDIRHLSSEVGLLPRAHGSGLFTRGQTQSLCVTTLGTGDDEQMIDALEGEMWKRFILHYNFPSFSVGETRPNRGPGRREIGHGALAERALAPVIPAHEDFPYTIRLVSEILESNGSSSMASVCAGTLSLMDAGIPLKAPVAGMALGLVTRSDKWVVLTDIAGIEDHHGDMDFKAAGTRQGLTALQMDLKIDGITEEMLKEAFDQAKEARFKVLDHIQTTMDSPRAELSSFAPRMTVIKVNPAKIGEIIGPGGKNIKRLTEETGAKINIEDDGSVYISSIDAKASEEAIERIKAIVEEPEMGKVYQAKVKKLMNFGAFCEFIPGRDGLCHVSEVSEGFVKAVNDYLRVGDEVPVKVIGVDDNGKVSLSIKQAKEGGMPVLPPDAERDPIEESGGRDRGRGGGRPRGGRPPRR
ncbi:polyribonucleotide nucleotidyltransferase [Omnitrophica bacterium]|nr:polyribonucleotide nucleotidyltransferase [Candidatus Omnitrophota bacterium]